MNKSSLLAVSAALAFAQGLHAAAPKPVPVPDQFEAAVSGTISVELPGANPKTVAGSHIAVFKFDSKKIFSSFAVNAGKTADYDLVLDTSTNQLLLRGIKTSANKADIVVLDLGAPTTGANELARVTSSGIPFSLTDSNVSSAADATGTVLEGFKGQSLNMLKGVQTGAVGVAKPTDTFSVIGVGKNTINGATNTKAIFQFSVKAGKQFARLP